MTKSSFIINPFNRVFFGLLAVIAILIVALTLILKNKSIKTKKIVLVSIGSFNIALWFLYKIWLFRGVEALQNTGYTFDIFQELPLHLCNISLFLFLIGVIKDYDVFKAYCFYVATFGAFMAFVSPSKGFFDCSLFELHNVGYYFTHSIIIINGILLVTLGLFKPNFKAVPKVSLLLVVLSLFAHIVNFSINSIFNESADYFYTMHNSDISLLNFFWSLIPVKYLYLIPGVGMFAVFVAIVTIPFYLSSKRKNRLT